MSRTTARARRSRRIFSPVVALVVSMGLSLGAAIVVAAPAQATTPTDDVGFLQVGDFGFFDPLQNDDTSPGDTLVIDSAPAYVDTDGFSISVDASGLAEPTDVVVDYTVNDDLGDPVGSATLTVHVLDTNNLRADALNGSVKLTWPGLTPGVTGVRISYSEDFVFDHEPDTGKTTVGKTGTGPWTIAGLTNDTTYYFYVTAQDGSAEQDFGPYTQAQPRAFNQAPVAVDDHVSLVSSDPVTFYPADNDQDPDFDYLQIVGHSAPGHGSVTCDSFSCEYTPLTPIADDTFTYTVSDGHGGSDTGTVQVLVRNVNAVDDNASTFVEESTVVAVLGNDTGTIASDVVEVSAVPAGISAYATDDERGVEVFGETPGSYDVTYEVLSEGHSVVLDTAVIHVTVGAKRPLVANDDEWSTEIEVSADFDVWTNDRIEVPGGFPVTASITVPPTHGTAGVSLEPRHYGDDNQLRNVPVVHYTPANNYHGTDTLTYKVIDANGNNDTAVVTIDVQAVPPSFFYADTGISQANLSWDNPASPALDQVVACYNVGNDRTTEPPAPTRPCAAGHTVPIPAGTPDQYLWTGLTNDVVYTVALYAHFDDGTPAGVWSDAEWTSFRPGIEAPTITAYDGGPSNATIEWQNPPGSTGTTITWSSVGYPDSPADGTTSTVGSGVTTTSLSGLPAGTVYVSLFATRAASGTRSDPERIAVTVGPGNHAPDAVNDALTVPKNGFGYADVLDNDTDADTGDYLEVIAHTDPAHGDAYCGFSGCSYDPDFNYTGTDSFTYTITDHRFGRATATVNVTVTDPPVAPVADDTSVTVTRNVQAAIDLSDLVYDANGGPITYSVVTPPANGSLSCAPTTGLCTYTGTTVGTYTFVYRATDNTARTDDGTVTLTVVDNQVPSTLDPDVTVAPGGSRSFTAAELAYDPDGDPLTFALVSQAAKGTAACTATGCSYTANAAVTGQDSFSYSVSDGKGGTDTGSVLITLQGANHAPVATNTTKNVSNAAATVVDLTALVSDQDGNPLTYAKVAGPTPAGAGTVTCTSAGSCTYTPTTGFTGQLTFTYKANDGTVDSNTATVTINVSQGNRAPVAVDDTLTLRNDAPKDVNVATNDTDADGNALTFVKASDPSHGTATCTAAGVCTYTANVGYTGPDSFTYTVSDGQGGSDLGTVSVTVTANQVPVAGDDSASTKVGHPVTVNTAANDSDADGDTLTYSLVEPLAAHGTVVANGGGSFTYTPTALYSGPDAFTYSVSDGHGGTDTATVSITVVVNHAPVATTDTLSAQTATNAVVDVAANDTDSDGDPLTYAKASDPAHGTVACTAAGSCTYASAAGYTGADSFTYTVSDAFGGQATGTVNVTVSPKPNHVPVANNDSAVAKSGVAVSVNVAANDADPDGDPLTYAKATDPAHGTATCTAAGSCGYTSAAGYVGTDSFTYTASDGKGGSATGTVTISVVTAVVTGSATIQLKSRPLQSIKKPVVVTGVATPARAGAEVHLEVLQGSSWNAVATATESATGAYSFSLKQKSGAWSYRVVVDATADRTTITTSTVATKLYAVSVTAVVVKGDEYLTVKNTGKVAVNLKGWTVKTKDGVTLKLGGISLKPRKSVDVHPGKGKTTKTDVYLGGRAAFADKGGSLKLLDKAKVVVAAKKW